MKTLQFVGSSLDELRDFPEEARHAAGFELDAIQRGLMPSDFKPCLLWATVLMRFAFMF